MFALASSSVSAHGPSPLRMHDTALEFGALFFQAYATNKVNPRIVDVGACDVNGSLRSVAPNSLEYVGLDFDLGPGVDIVLEDPYRLPLEDDTFDFCVSSSTLEHAEFFWLSFLEMMRIVRPNGLVYLNVPSNGEFHRHPKDCWRFYPDSGLALQNWACRNGFPSVLLESFIGRRRNDQWNDFVAVFLKDASFISEYPNRIVDRTDHFTNGYRHGEAHRLRPAQYQEDQSVLTNAVSTFRRLVRPLRSAMRRNQG